MVSQLGLRTIVGLHNNVRAGTAKAGDYAAAYTAAGLVAASWEESGVHRELNTFLKQGVADHPYATWNEELLSSVHQSVRSYGSMVTFEEMRQMMFPDERRRQAAIAFLSGRNAIQTIEQLVMEKLRLAGRSGLTPAFLPAGRSDVRSTLIQSNWEFYAGWGALYLAVMAMSCPPCAISAGWAGVFLAIYSVW